MIKGLDRVMKELRNLQTQREHITVEDIKAFFGFWTTHEPTPNQIAMIQKHLNRAPPTRFLPKFFYHGTGSEALKGIQKEGLKAPVYFAPNPKVAVTQAIESAYAGSQSEDARHAYLEKIGVNQHGRERRDMKQGDPLLGTIPTTPEGWPPKPKPNPINWAARRNYDAIHGTEDTKVVLVPPQEQPVLLRVKHARMKNTRSGHKSEPKAILEQIKQTGGGGGRRGVAFNWPYEAIADTVDPRDIQVFGRTKGGKKKWVALTTLLKNPKKLAKFGLPALTLGVILELMRRSQGGSNETDVAT